jgi:hypothetical protein
MFASTAPLSTLKRVRVKESSAEFYGCLRRSARRGREQNNEKQAFNLTVSETPDDFRRPSRDIAARTSLESPGEGDSEAPAHRCDRVRDVPLGSDRRRLWVDNRWERQVS